MVCAAVVVVVAFFFVVVDVVFVVVVDFLVVVFFTVVAGAGAGATMGDAINGTLEINGTVAATEEEAADGAGAVTTGAMGGVLVAVGRIDAGVWPDAAAWLMPAANALIASMEPMLAAAVRRVARWNSCCDRSMPAMLTGRGKSRA